MRVLSVSVESVRNGALKIKSRLGDGTGVLIVFGFLSLVLRFGSNLVLTRLLDPEAFGIVAIAFSLATILALITDVGVRPYYTRRETVDDDVLHTAWTVKFIRDCGIGAVMFVAAGPLASAFGHPEAAGVVRGFSLTFFLEAAKSPAMFVLLRERRLFRLTLLEVAGQVATVAATLASAAILRNYWAILIGSLFGLTVQLAATYWISDSSLPRFKLHPRIVAELYRFMRITIPSSMITLALTQADRIYLGRAFPIIELGFYTLALGITGALGAQIGRYFVNVYYPLVAQRFRDSPSSLRRDAYASRWRFTLILLFLLGGLVGSGELVAQLLFDDSYLRVGFYIGIVALAPIGELLRTPGEHLLSATGFIRATLTANVIRLGFVLIAGPLVYWELGAIAVLGVIVLSEYAPIPYFWWRLQKISLLDLRWEAAYFGVAVLGFGLGSAGEWCVFELVKMGILPKF